MATEKNDLETVVEGVSLLYDDLCEMNERMSRLSRDSSKLQREQGDWLRKAIDRGVLAVDTSYALADGRVLTVIADPEGRGVSVCVTTLVPKGGPPPAPETARRDDLPF